MFARTCVHILILVLGYEVSPSLCSSSRVQPIRLNTTVVSYHVRVMGQDIGRFTHDGVGRVPYWDKGHDNGVSRVNESAQERDAGSKLATGPYNCTVDRDKL